jgi:Cu/Ag efflux protein CusF
VKRARNLAAAAGLALLAACGGGEKAKQAAPAPDVYHTRGVVEKLPSATGPDHAIYIHHVAIPEYRDDTGAVVGMGTMTMPFPLAKGLKIDGLAPGDPVAFTFAVTWKPRSGYEITELRELPAGTVIEFAAPEARNGDTHP